MNSILGFTAGATRAQAPVVMARLIINMLPARPAREIFLFPKRIKDEIPI